MVPIELQCVARVLRAAASAIPDERLPDVRDALDFLEREGYRRCDIPVCNCGRWHGGHWQQRLREIEEVVEPENGETLLAAVKRVCALPDEPSALSEMEARKDAAYLERNQLVAALSKVFPSGVARTAIEGWSEDWHGCVYIDLPTGQASWHFHDSQMHLFSHLPPYAGKWDGHTTDEKYARLSALPDELSAARDDALRDLVGHMKLHSGYTQNGYRHMTTPQKALYDSIDNLGNIVPVDEPSAASVRCDVVVIRGQWYIGPFDSESAADDANDTIVRRGAAP
jgi:hypothetical protein